MLVSSKGAVLRLDKMSLSVFSIQYLPFWGALNGTPIRET